MIICTTAGVAVSLQLGEHAHEMHAVVNDNQIISQVHNRERG